MQITIEENLVEKIVKIAENKKESPAEFVNSSLREIIRQKEREVIRQKEEVVSDEEKVRRTLQAYRKFPQQPEEYEIWFDEQVWEDE